MSDTDRETLSRLLTEQGTRGMAEALVDICREHGKTDPEPGMECWWEQQAIRFEAAL